MSLNIKTLILAGISILLFVLSLVKATPMTATEVDGYLTQISELSHVPGGRHDLDELREFFSSDDGESFYTVNLYKYHDNAQYVKSGISEISGSDAYEKFSSVMVKLLLNNYSYPVFGSNWLDLSDKGWDRIVIVKYRSRRDMAKIFSDPEFSIASEHKWASIQKHDRFVVKALHLPEVSMLFVFFIVVLLIILITGKKRIAKK